MTSETSGLSELEQQLADRFAIDDLMVRYIEAIDNKDWDLLDTVFTPDAVLDYSTSGGPDAKGAYPEIKQWLQGALAAFPLTQHMIGKSKIELEGDTAKCRTIFHNPMVLPVNSEGNYDPDGSGQSVFVVGGWYEDTCQRTPDGWRIVHKFEQQAYVSGSFPPGFAPGG